MAIYAISDLHLALSIDKPMDIFGNRWVNYMEKLKNEWTAIVKEEDWVIIPGDISWATYLEQAAADFSFIEKLPGKKIISKGNHDYWWTTHSKLDKFISKNNFLKINFMHNNSFVLDNIILCGTRGWESLNDNPTQEDSKIFNRELLRLELSLNSIAERGGRDIIVAMHYPPFTARKEPTEFIDIMKKYRVNTCIYGHLHGEGFKNAVEGTFEGINFKLVSADYLLFRPFKLK